MEAKLRSTESSAEALGREQNVISVPIIQVQKLRRGGIKQQAQSPPLSDGAEVRFNLDRLQIVSNSLITFLLKGGTWKHKV